MSLDIVATDTPSCLDAPEAVDPTTALAHHVLARLHQELISNALLISTTASIATGLAEGAAGLSRSMLIQYLPPVSTAIPILVERLQGLWALSTLMRRLSGLHCDLEALRAASTRAQCVARRTSDLASLAVGWQRLAGDVRAVLEDLACMLPAASVTGRNRMAWVLSLLEAVEQGETPCIDAYGRVLLPTGVEKRQLFRHTTSQHVHLAIGDSLQRALVIDASVGGVGVWGLRDCEVGDSVRILVGPGRGVSGAIVWREGRRAGIRLDASSPALPELLHNLMLQNDETAA